ncbi:MAG: fused MFS/spermidine synthase [Verrucomicrobiota bacterium]|jgi:tetratricopeptide (TPR) repeat protein
MLIYALTIFTGAFLLFLVQPLIGKYILPWFGGVPAVWTTCMLFFQVLLLGGYAYAHFSSRRLKPRAQAIMHLALVVAALALLPITPADSWKPDGTENPTLRILALLAVSIGLPYFVLASTSPLMQHWFSRTHPGVSPYRLFALSNVGSLLALVSFPFFFETQFTRTTQARLWGWGMAVYAIGCGFCAVKLWRAAGNEALKSEAGSQKFEGRASQKTGAGRQEAMPPDLRPSTLDRLLWLLLPAGASVLLLAMTNMMCQEVAVIPFLWVLPLVLYLLSFIICFDNLRWYARFPFAVALLAAWGGICWILFKGTEASIGLQLSVYSAGLFICCMVCHGELYRLRPNPRHLTGYYLMIAAGGALGGLFVAVIAPLIFTGYFELQWGLLLGGGLYLVVLARGRDAGEGKPGRKRARAVKQQRRLTLAGFSAALVVLGMALWYQVYQPHDWSVYRTRNFYGVLSVFKHEKDDPELCYSELVHGRTLHGLQFADPVRAAWPTTYYSESSGVGLVLRSLPAGQRRVGLVGLGAGTLATYAQAGDDFHFYEINPEVERLATSRFTFLSHCRGKVEITTGDARLSLEREPPQNFDLLVLDAFSSDAIPVHLLTREAFTIYQRHLKTNGIIAVHVTSGSLNLEPVVANLAPCFNYQLITVESLPPRDQPWITTSFWVLLSRDGAILDSPAIRLAGRPPLTNSVSIRLWTDDFASLFQILRSELALQDNPEFEGAQSIVAHNLYQQGDFAGAIAQFRHALKTLPHSPLLLNNLAFLLGTCPDASLRNVPEATRLAEKACQLTHYRAPAFLSTLGVVYSEAGRFPEAIWMAEKACALAGQSGEQALLQKNQELLELYRAHRPYDEAGSPNQTKPSAIQPFPGQR